MLLFHQRGDDVATHVVVGVFVDVVFLDGVEQYLGTEDVVTHRREGDIGVIRSAGGLLRLFEEFRDAVILVSFDAAERCRVLTRNTDAGYSHSGTGFDVLIDHLLWIHPIDVVSTEHDDVVGFFVVDKVQRLSDGIGRAGVPARPEALLSWHRSNVSTSDTGHTPCLRNVTVE